MVSKYRANINPTPFANPSRSQFQPQPDTKATDIVQGLAKFAQVGGAIAKDYFDNEVAKDKIVQTQRAWKGQTPTDDATTGGRKAAALVGLNLASAKASQSLLNLAESGIDDEAFEEATRTTWDNTMAEVRERYDVDEDMQSAMVLEMQKTMPAITAKREAFNIKQEIIKRQEDVRDTFLLQRGDGEFLPAVTETALNRSQLTQPQVEEALIEAIKTSEDPTLIEYSKELKNDKGLSLYERSGFLQKMDKQVRSDTARLDAGKLSRAIEENDAAYLRGELTRDEYEERVKQMNDETGGAAYSKGSVASIHKKFSKEQEKQAKISNVDLALSNSKGEYVHTDLSKDETQELLDNKLGGYLKDGDPIHVAIRKTIVDGHKLATTSDRLQNVLKSFTNVVVDANVIEEEGVKSFNRQIQQFADIVENFPEEELINYADGKTAKIITNYTRFKSQGLSSSAALKQAQLVYRNNTPQNAGVIKEMSDQVVESLNPWFGFDPVPEHQKAWLSNLVRDQFAIHYDPASDVAKDIVTNWSETQITPIDGAVLRGNRKAIAASFEVHEDHIGKYHDGAINFNAKLIENKLAGTGLTLADAWLDVNQRTGMATVMLPHMVTDITFPAKDVKEMTKKVAKDKENKVAQARKAEKERIAKAKDAGGIYSVKRSMWDSIFN
jgi:hypothetical protein